MKFLLDENLPRSIAQTLRRNGFDIVSVSELGLNGASDEEISEYCIKNERAVVTLDYDFSNIFQFPLETSPGVIRLKLKSLELKYIEEHLIKCLNTLQDISVSNKLIVYTESKIRIRE
jgi:predicted nuclease of predicted toxin-antitoxin system